MDHSQTCPHFFEGQFVAIVGFFAGLSGSDVLGQLWALLAEDAVVVVPVGVGRTLGGDGVASDVVS